MQFLFWVLVVLGVAALLGAVGLVIVLAARPRPSADSRARGMRAAYGMPDPPAATANSLVRGGSFTGSDGRTIAWQSYEPDRGPAPQPAQPVAGNNPPPTQPLVIHVNGNTVHCGHAAAPAEPGQVVVPPDDAVRRPDNGGGD